MFYRIAIIGEFEYAASDPLWACVEELRCAGHAALALSPGKYLQGASGPGGVDFDSVCLSSFVRRFDPHVVVRYEPGMTAETLLAKAVDSSKPPMVSRAKHFVVFGFVGKDNFGDELIFSTLCDKIQRRYPEAYFSLIGHDPAASFKRQGVTSVFAGQKHEIDFMLNGAAALLFMAGIMFDGPFEKDAAGKVNLFLNPESDISGQVAVTLLAHMHDVPVFGMGIGAGPLANPDAQRLLRLASLCDPVYFTRDTRTTELLLAAGVRESCVRQKADLAFSIDVPSSAVVEGLSLPVRPSGDFFVISMREWGNTTQEFFEDVARLVGHLSLAYGLMPVFVDFSPIDKGVHEFIASKLEPGIAPMFYGTALDFQEVLALFSCAKFSVAMRLHASIISSVMHHPCIAFDYNDKVGALFEDMGQTAHLLQMSASLSEMLAAADDLMASYNRDTAVVSEYAQASKRKALEAFEEMFAVVDSREQKMSETLTYSRTVSAAEVQLMACRRELQELREKEAATAHCLEAARAEIDEIMASYTWKAGDFVVRPLRWLRRALRG